MESVDQACHNKEAVACAVRTLVANQAYWQELMLTMLQIRTNADKLEMDNKRLREENEVLRKRNKICEEQYTKSELTEIRYIQLSNLVSRQFADMLKAEAMCVKLQHELDELNAQTIVIDES
jgi:hypothetical protein